MRRGIGLRGYAQQDPLNEFRREAFRLYEELRGLIRHGVASSDLPGHRPAAAAAGCRAVAGAGRRARPALRDRCRRTGRRGGDRGGTGQPSDDAAAAGSAILRGGGLPAAPAARNVQRVAGRCAGRRRRAAGTGRDAARPAAPGPATRRPARASAATTRAGAGPAQKYKKCHGQVTGGRCRRSARCVASAPSRHRGPTMRVHGPEIPSWR